MTVVVAGTMSISEETNGRAESSSAVRVKAARAALGAGVCGRSAGELGKAADVVAVCKSGVVSGDWAESRRRADLLTGFIIIDGS